MPLSDERKFVTFPRGKVRDDIILARFRNSLRGKINPDTNQQFTEDEIAIITQEDSRFFIEADAIDLYGQAAQQRALWFADQVRPERAASGWLKGVHGKLWLPGGLLPATGGSGPVAAKGSPGTIYVGSTTLGDPTATKARDPSGKRYQVLVTGVANGSGNATLQLQAIDPGSATNLAPNTLLTWISPPIGTDPTATVSTAFSGGFDLETEFEFSQRIMRRISNQAGSGNNSQFRLWASQASNAVQDGFVYASALHAGSVIVCVVQKRGNAIGPLGRIPSFGTLTAAAGFLTPPNSPVVPQGVHVLVVPPNSEQSDLIMRLAMPKGSTAGWTDVTPWPTYTPAFPQGVRVTSVAGMPTYFDVQTDNILLSATGTNVPALALWDVTNSRFVELDVLSVVWQSANTHRITLNSPPAGFTIATNQVLSPGNQKADTIAEAFQAYFDSLGPGELLAETNPRYVRAKRFPYSDLEYPTRAGQSVIATLDDYLGGALSEGDLEYISKTTPTIPAVFATALGPNLLTLGRVGIYPM
jgi:hypothetical protein